jgi:hypothetical protein
MNRKSGAARSLSAQGFTEKQGHYLAFIYTYSQMFRRPPAEADMQRHAANPRRLGAGRPIVNGRQRQKPPSLRAILRLPRKSAQLRCLEVPAQRYWNSHDEPPSFATNESERN